MDFKRALLNLIIIGVLIGYGLAQFVCDPINLAISTDSNKTSAGSDMTYIGRPTNIQCSFSCDNCTKTFLYWIKDGQVVYRLRWMGGNSGPEPGYENRVRLVKNDTVNGIYVLEWDDTVWDDLLPGRNDTTWDCAIRTDICLDKANSTAVEYYKFPEQSEYANGVETCSLSDELQGTGPVNCSVISRPDSQITMIQGNQVKYANFTCIPYSTYESICSITVPVFEFSDGFQCNVKYNSPESGAYEDVTADGCSDGLPPRLSANRLSTGEIVAIALGCTAFVASIGLGVFFYMKHHPGTLN